MSAGLVAARENCTLAPLAVLPLGFQHILRFYRRVLPVKQLTKVSCSKLRFSRSFTDSVQELVIVQWMCRRVALENRHPTRRRSCDFTARRIPWLPPHAADLDPYIFPDFFVDVEFVTMILGSGRCPSRKILKFWSRWSPEEPEMILKCPDQAPGQLQFLEELKILYESRSHMPPQAKPPLRK